jgi:hypothetical protein
VTDKVSHPYKTTGKIIALYTYFLSRKQKIMTLKGSRLTKMMLCLCKNILYLLISFIFRPQCVHIFNSLRRFESLIPCGLLYKIYPVLFNKCFITCGLSFSRWSGTDLLLLVRRCGFQNRNFIQPTVFSSLLTRGFSSITYTFLAITYKPSSILYCNIHHCN